MVETSSPSTSHPPPAPLSCPALRLEETHGPAGAASCRQPGSRVVPNAHARTSLPRAINAFSVGQGGNGADKECFCCVQPLA